jgi:hypothetical protein
MRHCAAKHIPMVVVKYQCEKVKQAFVRIRDRNAVLSFRPVRVLNKPQTANQETPNRAVSSPINRTAYPPSRASRERQVNVYSDGSRSPSV